MATALFSSAGQQMLVHKVPWAAPWRTHEFGRNSEVLDVNRRRTTRERAGPSTPTDVSGPSGLLGPVEGFRRLFSRRPENCVHAGGVRGRRRWYGPSCNRCKFQQV